MNRKRRMLLLLVALFFVPFFQMAEVRAESYEITESYVGYYDQYHDGELRMHYKAKMHKLNGEMAYCISMTKTSEPGKAKEVSIKKYLPGDELVMACLAQKHIFDMDQYSKAEKYMLTQCMVWYIQREHIGDGGWRQYVSDIDMSISQQKTFFKELEKKVKEEASRYEGHGTAWKNVEFDDVQEVGILLAPTLKTGDLTLQKISVNAEAVKGNHCYSLEGAEYGVYLDPDCKKQAAVMKTDKDGNTQKITLEIGQYYVKEIKASPGYELDSEIYPITIKSGEEKALTVKEKPAGVPLELYLEKLDAETKGKALGAASLEGAEFTVCYYDGYYTQEDLPEYESYESSAKKRWVLGTVKYEKDGKYSFAADIQDESCLLGGEPFDRLDDQKVLLLGTLSLEETKFPEGYTKEGSYLEIDETKERIESGKYVTQIALEDGKAKIRGGQKLRVYNQVKRGDLALRKIQGKDQKAMAGITFRLTSVTTGESHTFTTDENGEYDTSSSYVKHSKNTNSGEKESGIWFGMTEGQMTEVNDDKGALPYDSYLLEEVKGEHNKGKKMYSDTVKISKDKKTVYLNNIENEDEPDQPEKPQKPQKPQKGKTLKKQVVSKKPVIKEIPKRVESVKTGDNNSLMLLVVLFILSCVVIITCGRIARKD